MKRKKRLSGSKWRKHKLLDQESDFRPYLPDTALYKKDTLEEFADRYGVLYVKPVNGQQGKNVLRIIKRDDSCELVTGTKKKTYNTLTALHNAIEKIRRGKAFIVQEGIDLATWKGRPVDLRVVVEKEAGKWTILKWFSKSAGHNQIVTNLHRGGTPHTITNYLIALGYKRKRRLAFFRELRELSLSLAEFLGKKYPNIRYGLDMGLDRKGRLWLIEINTRPAIKDNHDN